MTTLAKPAAKAKRSPDRLTERRATDTGPVAREREMRAWLHDNTLQTLEYIARGTHDDDGWSVKELAAIAGRAADELRDAVELGLHNRSNDIELVSELHKVVADVAPRTDCDMTLDVGPIDGVVKGEAARTLADAVREALNNVQKHSHASSAEVYCEARRGRPVLVTVSDNGRGFNPDDPKGLTGMGLRHSIAERVKCVGGSTQIKSRPSQGTVIAMKVENHAC